MKRGPDLIAELEGVHKEYPLGKTQVKALRGVDLQMKAGEFIALAGPSGSGKTTLLNLLGCVDTATRGDVRILGQETGALSERARTRLRLHSLGFIFQSFNLIKVLNVSQNVELPLLLQGGLSSKERQGRVEEIIEWVDLSPQRHQRPAELSGGQRQRVAIARALVTRPALVLADEPTANLDSETGRRIIELMRMLNQRERISFLFSTHDAEIMAASDRGLRIIDGQIL